MIQTRPMLVTFTLLKKIREKKGRFVHIVAIQDTLLISVTNCMGILQVINPSRDLLIMSQAQLQ